MARLWASGRVLTSEAAVALALDLPTTPPRPRDESPALSVVDSYQVASAPPSSLTQREHQIATLVASGRSNKAIAGELSISPTTAARHVANIMAKLGFNSRTQIAAWIAEKPQEPGRRTGLLEPGLAVHGAGAARSVRDKNLLKTDGARDRYAGDDR